MTRQEWVAELKMRLSIFTDDEIKKVLDYYDELYADMSEQSYFESEIIASFGNPYDVAKKILSEYESNLEDISRKNAGRQEDVVKEAQPQRQSRDDFGRNAVVVEAEDIFARDFEKDATQQAPFAGEQQSRENKTDFSKETENDTQENKNSSSEKNEKTQDANIKETAERGVKWIKKFYMKLSQGGQLCFKIIFWITLVSLAIGVVSTAIAFSAAVVGFFVSAALTVVVTVIDTLAVGFSGSTLVAIGVVLLLIAIIVITVPLIKKLWTIACKFLKWSVGQIKYILAKESAV